MGTAHSASVLAVARASEDKASVLADFYSATRSRTAAPASGAVAYAARSLNYPHSGRGVSWAPEGTDDSLRSVAYYSFDSIIDLD